MHGFDSRCPCLLVWNYSSSNNIKKRCKLNYPFLFKKFVRNKNKPKNILRINSITKFNLNSIVPFKRGNFVGYNFNGTFFTNFSKTSVFNSTLNKMYLTFLLFYIIDITKKRYQKNWSSILSDWTVNLPLTYVNVTAFKTVTWLKNDGASVSRFFKDKMLNKYIVFRDKVEVNFKNYYLEYYFLLLIHNYFLKNKNKNKTLGLYAITDSNHFLRSRSFSSSLDNVVKFKRSFFKGNNIERQGIPSLFFSKLKGSLSSRGKFFTKINFSASNLYKNKFILLIIKFFSKINLFSPKWNRKVNHIKFLIKRHFAKLFFKQNRVINKKSRYLKFLMRTKNFNRNFNSNIKIRLKKMSDISRTYTVGLSYIDNVSRLDVTRYRLTSSSRNTFFDFRNYNNLLGFNKIFSIFFFFNNSFFSKVINSVNLFFTKTNNLFNMPINFLKKLNRVFYSSSNFNIIPSKEFNFKIKKLIISSNYNIFFKENITPWVYSNLVRFIEFCSSKKVLLQLYSFMNQSIDLEYITLYKRWIPRLSYYERRLGHRFFLEEALHILHIGFTLRDVKLISNWLKAIIKRISFWKTRFIFRFLKYLFNNYFVFILKFLGVKGFKVKLKGKISVAGNSRKRSILYRVGQTSHSTNKIKVIHNLALVTTFTGVMGLQTWIFY